MPSRRIAIRPGVAAILRDAAGRVLLQRRRIDRGWAPPSGVVEPRESLEAALRREMREETGLEVAIERLVGVYSDPAYQVVRALDGTDVHYVTALFACRHVAGRLHGSSEEAAAWEWFASDALPPDLLPYARVWLEDAFSAATGVRVR